MTFSQELHTLGWGRANCIAACFVQRKPWLIVLTNEKGRMWNARSPFSLSLSNKHNHWRTDVNWASVYHWIAHSCEIIFFRNLILLQFCSSYLYLDFNTVLRQIRVILHYQSDLSAVNMCQPMLAWMQFGKESMDCAILLPIHQFPEPVVPMHFAYFLSSYYSRAVLGLFTFSHWWTASPGLF